MSELEAVDGEVSAPSEELLDWKLLLVELIATSFRVMDFPNGVDEPPESREGRVTASSLDLESWEDLGVPTVSAGRSVLGESVLGRFAGASLRIGKVDVLEDRGVLVPLRSTSELVLEVPALLLFGTSPKRNCSFGVWLFAEFFGEPVCCNRVSSFVTACDAFADDFPPDAALRRLSLISEVSSAEGCRPLSWKAI